MREIRSLTSRSEPPKNFNVPSTPMPPDVNSGDVSPAWDPSSRTPQRLPEDEEQHDQSPPQLIKRPARRANRKGGYDVKEVAGVNGSLYEEIKVC